MYDLSIVIVNYNTADLLYNCIQSVREHSEGLHCEILVADNASTDGSVDLICKEFPEVVWIDMGYNAGFSRANNAAIKVAKSEYIFFLNSDAELVSGTLSLALKKYQELSQKYKLGVLGFQVRGFDGNIQFNSNLSFPSIRAMAYANAFVAYLKKGKKQQSEDKLEQHNRFHETAWIGLSCGIIRKDVIIKDDLFLDEDFFLYHEDVEWGWRLNKKGYRSFFIPDVYTLHVNSGSTSSSSDWRAKQIILSEFLFVKKKRGIIGLLFLYLLMWTNIKSLYLFKWKNNLLRREEKWVEDSLSYALMKFGILNRYWEKLICTFETSEYLKYVE